MAKTYGGNGLQEDVRVIRVSRNKPQSKSLGWSTLSLAIAFCFIAGHRSLAAGTAQALPGRHIPTIEGAADLVSSPDGKSIFVVGPRSGQLISGWQDNAIAVAVIQGGAATAPVDARRRGGAVFSQDGSRLYWAPGGAAGLSIHDATNGAWVGELRVESSGAGTRSLGDLAINAEGTVIFATDVANRSLIAISTRDGRVLSALGIGPVNPELVWTGDRLFGMDAGEATGVGAATLWEVDAAQPERLVVLHRWRSSRVWSSVQAGTADGQGSVADHLAADGNSVFVSRSDADALVRIDRKTRKVAAWQVLQPTPRTLEFRGIRPNGLAVSASGNRLFVAESGLDAVGVLEANTLTYLGHMATPGYPHRLVVSPEGNKLACLSLRGLTPGMDAGPVSGENSATGAPQPLVTILDVPPAAELEQGTAGVLERAGVTAVNSRGSVLSMPAAGNGNGSGSGQVGMSTIGVGASTRPLPPVQLPVEVLGLGGTRETARMVLTGVEALRGSVLCLTVHGVQYENKARVRINGTFSESLNNKTVRIIGNALAFGGFGGGFHTIPIEMDLPRGVLREGENLIEFEYTRQDSYAVSGFKRPENRVDDASSGFRVIRMNLRDRTGAKLLGPDRFAYDDPTKWGPPEELAAELDQAIQDGWRLWRGLKPDGTPFRLKNHSGIGLTPSEIKATCSDCHAENGRDLKYYNYSNRSIVARSKIHGLTEDEGRRIAAYVRTLPDAPVVPGARPWNPPFQPGPGMDSRPAYEWAAGAGLEAVLEDPVETFNGIFPGVYSKTPTGEARWDLSKITSVPIQPKAYLSIREVPISMQLMDWNHWLPKVHPMDGYSEMMETNTAFRTQFNSAMKVYTNTVKFLHSPAGKTNYGLVASFSRSMLAGMMGARFSQTWDRYDHTLKEAQRRYPLMLVALVKAWEIYTEFDLGDRIACATCGPAADERSWRVSTAPFSASPNIAGLLDTREPGVEYKKRNGHGIGNNSGVTFNYFSSAWYHLQLILDHGNRNPLCGVNVSAPFDWAYVMAHLHELGSEDSAGSGISMMPLMYLYLAKGPQIFDTGLGVDRANNGGWHPYLLIPKVLHQYTYGTTRHQARVWKDIPPEARARLLDVLYRVWLDKCKESSRDQYYVPTIATQPDSYLAYMEPGSRIGDGNGDNLANRLYYVFTWKLREFDGSLTGFQVNPALQNEILDWAKTIWPKNADGTAAPWDELRPKASSR